MVKTDNEYNYDNFKLRVIGRDIILEFGAPGPYMILNKEQAAQLGEVLLKSAEITDKTELPVGFLKHIQPPTK